MSLMQITIDSNRCQVPIECRKCAIICPQAVFRFMPAKVERFKPTEAKDWVLYVGFRAACVGCMDCVKVCPEKAIRVKVVTKVGKGSGR